MNNDQHMPNDVTRTVPPSKPDARIPEDDLAGHQASWPTVVGIISIIYAFLGIFANGCGAAFIYLGGQTLALMGIDAGDLQVPMWLKIVQTGMGVFGVGLGILLLAGAIGLIRRKIASLGVLKLWAVLAILSTFVGIGIGFAAITPNVQLQLDIQEAIRDKMKSDGGDPSQIPELNKDEETMRSESIRNLAIFGALPIIYPAIIGFLVTSRKRLDQADAWEEHAPVA
jgi:hypothetical protein